MFVSHSHFIQDNLRTRFLSAISLCRPRSKYAMKSISRNGDHMADGEPDRRNSSGAILLKCGTAEIQRAIMAKFTTIKVVHTMLKADIAA